MTGNKIYKFLFMPFIPLLRLGFSFKILFIPDLILSISATLVILILNEIYMWEMSLSFKLMLLLIFQVIFSLLLNTAKPLEKTNKEIYEEFHFDRIVAFSSLFLTTIVISMLLFIYQSLK